MTTDTLKALDELEARAREAYVSGPGKTVSDLVSTLRAALTPPADDEIVAIRRRHEAARDEPETWTESHAWAHLDRATLLRAVDRLTAELSAERARRVEVEGAAIDVLSERERQKSVEGYTTQNDDEYHYNELALAAACYAMEGDPEPRLMYNLDENEHVPIMWPWDAAWWKPSGHRRNLVKAGALILAEIERLDRKKSV